MVYSWEKPRKTIGFKWFYWMFTMSHPFYQINVNPGLIMPG